MQLNRERILEAALTILDEYGLSDLTMRRLARHLGVAPGAVYWHIAHKQELLSLVAREILSDLLKDSTSTPRDWCNHLHELLTAHRDGAEVVAAAVAMSSLRLDLTKALVSSLRASYPDLSASDLNQGAATILHYLLGAIVLEQSAQQAGEFTSQPGEIDFTEKIDTDRGVEMILTGLRALSQISRDEERKECGEM
ncbi:TetR family transcriptional regulator [Corynebacterium poyangense]|uniref:TetR family transcriptional regulator n=1 Tax=Corynebacterium poyangense TaxID=2684405 RepID=A0A7H0SPQ3_9CORY|nr:TetR family transcriptional regulator [Corynebacterium poyangense]MBZ8178114.1 TetR family transcriptional regulator [Corynebacterium poyangense]QNQ90528.1 TetR family transcriptional regulator [Corynebacterium poyangense]